MKKQWLLLFLMLTLLTLPLMSCGVLLPSAVGDDVNGGGIVMETQYPVYDKSVPMISVRMRNETDETAKFGTDWSIEVKRGNSWMVLPFRNNIVWNDLLHVLSPGGAFTFTVHFGSLDADMKAGTYRVVKKIGDQAYAAEFEIGDSPITAGTPYGFALLEDLPEKYSSADAEADGIVILGSGGSVANSEKIGAFFEDVYSGFDSQLRIMGFTDEGTAVLTDLIAEHRMGRLRILCRIDDTRNLYGGGKILSVYYSHFTSNGETIALGNGLVPTKDDYLLFAGYNFEGRGDAAAVIYNYNAEYPNYNVTTAGYWSADGMKYIALRDDTTLGFSIETLFEDGGSAGEHVGIRDIPGMVRITSVLWEDSDTAVLICDTETEGMTGYVFYNAAEKTVTGYTSSFYDYTVDENGKIMIPE